MMSIEQPTRAIERRAWGVARSTTLPLQLMTCSSVSPNIFISYAREDRHHVQRLRALLGAIVGEGAVFIEQDKVRAGSTWTLELARAIVDSTHFVVIWSSSARDSHWVNQEVTSVVELSREQPLRRIIPVRIDPTPLPQELQRFQRIDLFGLLGPEGDGWSLATALQLVVAVATVVGLGFAIHGLNRVLFGLVAMWIALASFVVLRFRPRCMASSGGRLICRLIRGANVTPSALRVLFVGGCACALLALAHMA